MKPPSTLTRSLPCYQCKTLTPTQYSAVLCAKCEELNRKTRCVGCFKAVDTHAGDAATDAHKNVWHTKCYRVFHPDSQVVQDEPQDPGLTAVATPSPTRNQLMSSAEAAAAITNRRRKSWWRPTDNNPSLAAMLAAEGIGAASTPVPETIPEHRPLSSAAGPSEDGGRSGGSGRRTPSESKSNRKSAQLRRSAAQTYAFRSSSYEGLAARIKVMGLVREHTFKVATYPDSVVGRELVDFLLSSNQCATRVEAGELGRQLVTRGFLKPLLPEERAVLWFHDDSSLYAVANGTPGPIDDATQTREAAASSDDDSDGGDGRIESSVRTFAPAFMQEQYFLNPRGRAGSGYPGHVVPAASEAGSITITEVATPSPVARPKSGTLVPVDAGVELATRTPTQLDAMVDYVSVSQRREKLETRDVKAGFLVKQGHKVRNWKRRWFVLRGHCLVYYRKPTDVEPAGSIDLADFFLDKGADPSHPLRIRLPSKRSPGHEYLIEAETAKDFVEWAKAIDGAMKEWEQFLSGRV